MDILTPKQESFTRNIFSGMNQYHAYREAGYNITKQADRTILANASRLANNVNVKARLAELREKAQDEAIGTVKERQKILTEIYRGRVGDFLDEHQNIKQGEPLTSAALQEVVTEDVKVGRGEDAHLVAITKIKLLNPVTAIAEHNKMDKIYSDAPIVNQDNRVMNIIVIDSETKDLMARVSERTGNLIEDKGNKESR